MLSVLSTLTFWFTVSDHEFGMLYEQWEDNDEDGPLDPEDLPIGHPDRPVPPIDMSIVKTPEDYLKQEKRSKTGMMFVNVSKSFSLLCVFS